MAIDGSATQCQVTLPEFLSTSLRESRQAHPRRFNRCAADVAALLLAAQSLATRIGLLTRYANDHPRNASLSHQVVEYILDELSDLERDADRMIAATIPDMLEESL
jgi:hypothetical protein